MRDLIVAEMAGVFPMSFIPHLVEKHGAVGVALAIQCIGEEIDRGSRQVKKRRKKVGY